MKKRKLINNSRAAFLISVVLISGGLTLLFFLSQNIEGYAGYCNYIRIPFFNLAKNIEVVFLTLFLVFVISLVLYRLACKLSFTKAISILLMVLLNLFFIAYQIIKYPRVISYSNWGFYPGNISRNDQNLGLDYHPLIIIFLIYSLTLIGYNEILKRNKIKKYYKITNWIVLCLMLVVGIVVLSNIDYEMCTG